MLGLTVGYSTRKSNLEFSEYLKKSSGLKNIQVVEKINLGDKSLTQVYNEIISDSTFDIVVLCHDDIYFDSKKWGEKLIKHFEKNNYGILGVAGSTFLPESGQWWEDKTKMVGIVNHEHQSKKWESKYSDDLGVLIKKTVIVDGLFIALHKKRIKEYFDENVKGFHMYDVDFCFRNFLNDVLVGVMFDIRITHKSIGQTNQQWEQNRINFSQKFSDKLPQKVKLDKTDKLKILFFTEKYEDLLDEFEKISKNKSEVYLISNKITQTEIKKFNKIGIKCFKSQEIPGYKLGDGKIFVKVNNQVVRSVSGEYYKTGTIKFDLIYSDSLESFNILKTLFSDVPKIFKKDSQNIPQHNSLIKIIEGKLNDIHNVFLDALNSIESKRQKIKIVSGYSEKGGSTTALVNLTNYFNNNGIDCTFYGPHKWHLDKCKSDLNQNLVLDSNDILLTHFLTLQERPKVKKVILICHEKWWFNVGKIFKYWDSVVFLHEEHRKYHSDYNGEYFIIPNFKENLIPNKKSESVRNIAGVIGAIEDRKQTHLSIQRALDDGCTKVLLFGKINDQNYFEEKVKPFLGNNVQLVGFTENKQNMYDSVGKVYHSSKGEVACLVKDECYLTDTEFYGNEETEHEVSKLTNNEIFDKWKKILEI